MTTNLELASVVARQVELDSVNLASAELSTSIDPLSAPPELEFDLGYRANYGLQEKYPDHVFVRVDLRLKAESEGAREEIMLLKVSYNLIYKLESAATYPVDALKYFAELNGPYNAWPYLRELVQTVAGRVGLSGLLLPVFRPAREEIDPQPAAAPAADTPKAVEV